MRSKRKLTGSARTAFHTATSDLDVLVFLGGPPAGAVTGNDQPRGLDHRTDCPQAST